MMFAAWAATALGLVPLIWCAILRPVGRLWWLVAAGYGVSFLADLGGSLGHADLAGNLYPLAQTGLLAIALWPLERAVHLIGCLTVVALLAVCLGAAAGHDLILATAANLLACLLALRVGGGLRWSLLTTFGLGGLCWIAYGADPGWLTWGSYQGCRLIGAAWFCWAATEAA